MCGICGKVYHDERRPVERPTLAAMCGTLRHRGPDDQGLYLDGPVGLGSTRLSIIDVACGHMPLANEDRTVWVVYNGETYNFPQLRARLERAGHHFATQSDTETIVHLYEEEGDDCVRSLDGMFAFALWDTRRRRLLLARDPLGIKPLFYAALDDRLVFGSEIKALLADGIERRLDPIALHDYLSLNYVPGPRTMFERVQKLLPGHRLSYDAPSRRLRVEQFWDVPPPAVRPHPLPPVAELEARLLDLLRSVVRDQLVSDVPVGAFLSGGVDSSLVVALMSEAAEQSGGPPVRTFSVGFREESFNELGYARIVAERFRTNHHELVLEPRAHELVTATVDHFDEPFADSSALATYAVSRLAASHIKVALSGDGGDELFGGYYTYQADKLATFYRRLPRALGASLLPWLVDRLPASDEKVSLDFKLKRFVQGGSLPPLPAHVAWKAFLDEEMKARLYAVTDDGGPPSDDGGRTTDDGGPSQESGALWACLARPDRRSPTDDGSNPSRKAVRRRPSSVPRRPSPVPWSSPPSRGAVPRPPSRAAALRRPTVELLRLHYDRYRDPDVLNRLLYVDLKVQLVDDMLTKVDRMSMAHSLEVRVPLLDRRLVEFVAPLPSTLKVRGLTLKYLLKRVAARLLPPEIVNRPKAGFQVPIARWLKTDLADLVAERLDPSAVADQGCFDPRVVARLVAEHRSGRRDHSRPIWSLLMFSLWHDRYMR